MHVLIVGMSESGKTTLAKIMAAEAKRAGLPVGVLDPLGDPDFNADFQTREPGAFLEHARTQKRELLVVDESGSVIGRYNEPMQWLATTSRHFGKSVIFCVQAATQIATVVRDQCTVCYVFRCSYRNRELIADEYDQPELLTQKPLAKGEFVRVPRFGEISRYRLDFAKRRYTLVTDSIKAVGKRLPKPEPQRAEKS